jgi:hypothetical protein
MTRKKKKKNEHKQCADPNPPSIAGGEPNPPPHQHPKPARQRCLCHNRAEGYKIGKVTRTHKPRTEITQRGANERYCRKHSTQTADVRAAVRARAYDLVARRHVAAKEALRDDGCVRGEGHLNSGGDGVRVEGRRHAAVGPRPRAGREPVVVAEGNKTKSWRSGSVSGCKDSEFFFFFLSCLFF